MSNKYPQYMTADGFKRSKKRPKSDVKKRRKVIEEDNINRIPGNEISLSTAHAKRIIRKRKLTRNRGAEQTLSPEAAKALAEALKGLLHS